MLLLLVSGRSLKQIKTKFFVGYDAFEDPTYQQFGVVAVDNQQVATMNNKKKMATDLYRYHYQSHRTAVMPRA